MDNTTQPGKDARRSSRVALSLPITVSGESADGPFREETRTLVVNAHGALISLVAKVSQRQTLVLKSPSHRDEQTCLVVRVGPTTEGQTQVGVEFTRPAPQFWHISFPPEDWTSADEMALAKGPVPQPAKAPPQRAPVSRDSNPPTASQPQGRTIYAGFWWRLAAASIDGLMVFAVWSAASALMASWTKPVSGRGAANDPFPLLASLMLNATCFYFIAMESSPWQASLGKRALGLYVTDAEGNRITLGRAAGRTFAKCLSAMSLGIGFVMGAFNQEKRAWHDRIAGCLVLRRQKAETHSAAQFARDDS